MILNLKYLFLIPIGAKSFSQNKIFKNGKTGFSQKDFLELYLLNYLNQTKPWENCIWEILVCEKLVAPIRIKNKDFEWRQNCAYN